MLITKENDYAVLIVYALADGMNRNVDQICEDQHIPTAFAYKILRKLAKAEIVRITRGASGGYRLIRGLGELTLLDIFQATDRCLALHECLNGASSCFKCVQGLPCPMRAELSRIQTILLKELGSHTLDELLKMGG